MSKSSVFLGLNIFVLPVMAMGLTFCSQKPLYPISSTPRPPCSTEPWDVIDIDRQRWLTNCLKDGESQVTMFDLTTLDPLFHFPGLGSKSEANSLLDMKADKILVSDGGSQLQLRDFSTGGLLRSIALPETILPIRPTLSPNADFILLRALVNKDPFIKVVNLEGRVIWSIPGAYAEFLSGNHQLVTIDTDGQIVRTWDFLTQEEVSEDSFGTPHLGFFHASPKCQGTSCNVRLFSYSGDRFWYQLPENRVMLVDCNGSSCNVQMWQHNLSEKIQLFQKKWDRIHPLEISLNATKDQVSIFSLIDKQNSLVVFDTQTGDEIRRVDIFVASTSPTKSPEDVQFTPDGSKFVLEHNPSFWEVRQAETGEFFAILDNQIVCHPLGPDLNFNLEMWFRGISSDGKQIYTYSLGGSSCNDPNLNRIYLWDISEN